MHASTSSDLVCLGMSGNVCLKSPDKTKASDVP